MKKIAFVFVAAGLLLGAGSRASALSPYRVVFKKSAPRVATKKAAAPRRNTPRVLAKIAGAPPVTARRSAPTRRLLALEYVRQASLAYGQGDYKRTLALCETASQWYPTYARAHIWKGAAYQKLGNHAQARSSYSWGRALAPDSADAARADRGLKELGYY